MTHNTSKKSKLARPLSGFGSIVLAALALPGVQLAAHAETAPEKGRIGLKYLDYQDSQPGFKRVKVRSPALTLLAPLGSAWALEGNLVVDDVSGATPRRHTDMSVVSGASTMEEDRTAGDLKITHYRPRASYSLGASHSSENDYKSTAVSAGGSWSTDSNNTTLHLGGGYTEDQIDPVLGGYARNVFDRRKKTAEVLLGLTQVASRVDLVQINYTHTLGKGYFSDPYKDWDNRPTQRSQNALLTRWNHHFSGDGSTLRSSYRYYQDSYDIRAHTAQVEWVKPLGSGFSLTPSARFYSQSQASFYGEAPFTTAPPAGAENSFDQRLSAFGAVTLGLKGAYDFADVWTVDAKAEFYQQRGDWHLGGDGSTGLATFSARAFQLGLTRKF